MELIVRLRVLIKLRKAKFPHRQHCTALMSVPASWLASSIVKLFRRTFHVEVSVLCSATRFSISKLTTSVRVLICFPSRVRWKEIGSAMSFSRSVASGLLSGSWVPRTVLLAVIAARIARRMRSGDMSA